MEQQQIRFNDGAAYEQMMGVWSRYAGEVFLDWLAPRQGLRWIDVGCGNGAFTDAPRRALRAAKRFRASIPRKDSSPLPARARLRAWRNSRSGDAMALPFPPDRFDAAIMALGPRLRSRSPPRAVAEMVRVVRPGGIVATYMWDMLGGGFPLTPIVEEVRADGP